jgi:hypothetical protein
MATTPAFPGSTPAFGSGPAPFTAPPMNDQAAAGLQLRTAAPQDPYSLLGNDQEALKLLTSTRQFCDPGREAFEWGWWRSLLYFLGRQWIYWDPQSRTWTDKRTATWIPKPVTNKIRETYDSIFALLQDIDLGVTARPIGRDGKAAITADLIDQMAPLLAEEHDMKTLMGEADFWAILLGNAYLHTFWDKDDPRNVTQAPIFQCQSCRTTIPADVVQKSQGTCPTCGLRAVAPTGQSQSIPIGAGRTIVVSPFELLLPLYAQSFTAVDRLIFNTWLPKHEIEALAPEAAKRVSWTLTPTQRSLQLYKSLAIQSDLPMTPQTWVAGGGSEQQTEGATVQYLWIKACKMYPQGVWLPFIGEGDSAVVARDLIANSGDGSSRPEIPYKKADGSALWPWVHYPYKRVGGRLYAQSAVDPILQKQDQINQIDSMTILTANRMGNPVWLEEKGAQVERFTGAPGMVVRWQRVGQNGGEPKRIGGENPPQSFFALRQQYLADIEEATGTYDVVKGAKPSGVEAFSALQLLVERSQSRFTPVFKARGEAYRQWFEVALELERTYGPDTRVQSVLGPNRAWTTQMFEKSDLTGSITIVVEDGSTTPKTALGKRAALEHANQLGLLNPTLSPDQNYAMLLQLGVPELNPTLDADVSSALQEQQLVEEWAANGMPTPAPPLLRMPWHDDATHFNEHRKWMNSDAVRDMLTQAGPAAAGIVAAFGNHLAEHEMMMIKKQMVMAMGQAGPDTGATSPANEGAGQGQAMRSSNANSRPPQG